jgi:hypothetical protein
VFEAFLRKSTLDWQATIRSIGDGEESADWPSADRQAANALYFKLWGLKQNELGRDGVRLRRQPEADEAND